MVAAVPLLLAGAAVGAGNASNANVDIHNEGVKMQDANAREQLRMQYENEKFNRQLQAGLESQRMKNEQSNIEYKRNRQDKLEDRESDRKFEMEKMDINFQNKRSLEGMRESGKNSRALLRRDGDSQSSNKQMDALKKTIETDERRLFDLKQDLGDPMKANDPERRQNIQSEMQRIQGRLGQNIMQLQQLQGGNQQAPQNTQKLNLQNILGLQSNQ
ncbi:MAG: hypothetical protein H6937_09450 [Burkholderiales bacterium]|nr:hypothetical protein [Burkholderiales bacterium]